MREQASRSIRRLTDPLLIKEGNCLERFDVEAALLRHVARPCTIRYRAR